MDQNQFKVIYTGQIQSGLTTDEVSQQFSSKFKLPLAKATKIIQANREVTIKARAEHVKAYKLKALLESFGMIVRLERAAIEVPKSKPEPSSADASTPEHSNVQQAGSWSLEPIESAEQAEQQEQAEHAEQAEQADSSDPVQGSYTDLSRPTVVLEKTKPAATEEAPIPEEKVTTTSSGENAVLSLVKSFGGWVLAGLGVLFVLVKKVGIFKIFKVGGLMTAAAFAGYQPDEICMGNERCESAVEEQIDDCWDQAGLDEYDLDYMSDEEYLQLKPKIEEDFVACFRYEDTAEKVFQSPLELRLDLIDNCTFSENSNCETLAESQFKACYDRHQIGYLVSARTTDFYQEVSDHSKVFKGYYSCFKDDNGQPIFSDVLAAWDELY